MQHDCIRLLRTGGLGFILKTAGPLFFDCPHQNDLTERRAVTHNQQSHPSRECNAKRPGNGNLLAFQSVDLLQNCDFWIHSPRLLEFHGVFWNFRPLKSGLMLFFLTLACLVLEKANCYSQWGFLTKHFMNCAATGLRPADTA